MEPFKQMITFFGVLFGGAILIATFRTLFKMRGTREWPTTTGRVLSSEVRSKLRAGTDQDHREEMVNYPFIEYGYEVAGETYRCHRLDMGEETFNYEIEETLGRYPVGAAIAVHYNPAQPKEAFLENLPLHKFAEGLGVVFVLIVGGGAAAIFVFNRLAAWATHALPNAQSPQGVVMIAGMGCMALLGGLGSMGRTLKQRRWTAVEGRVVSSRVEQYRKVASSGSGRSASITVFRPLVVYEYEVHGRRYESSKIADSVSVRTSVAAVAEKTVQRFPVGKIVTVRHNPANVTESVLEGNFSGFFFGVAMGSVLLGLAAALSGYFHHPH